jgi:hypothetical protein
MPIALNQIRDLMLPGLMNIRKTYTGKEIAAMVEIAATHFATKEDNPSLEPYTLDEFHAAVDEFIGEQ